MIWKLYCLLHLHSLCSYFVFKLKMYTLMIGKRNVSDNTEPITKKTMEEHLRLMLSVQKMKEIVQEI